ncbi:hypothetical protein FF1_035505 [Malus domestica]
MMGWRYRVGLFLITVVIVIWVTFAEAALTGPCSIDSPASAMAQFHVDDSFLAREASFITIVDFPDQRNSSSSPSPPSSSSSPSPTPTHHSTYPPTKSATAIQLAQRYLNPGPSLDSPPPSDTIMFTLKSIKLGDLGFEREPCCPR